MKIHKDCEKKINKKLLILILNFKDNHLIVLSAWFLILMTSCFTKLCSFMFQIKLCWDFLKKQFHTCNKVINKEAFFLKVMLGSIMWVCCLWILKTKFKVSKVCIILNKSCSFDIFVILKVGSESIILKQLNDILK